MAECADGGRCGWADNADHRVWITGREYELAVLIVVVMRRASLRGRMRVELCSFCLKRRLLAVGRKAISDMC